MLHILHCDSQKDNLLVFFGTLRNLSLVEVGHGFRGGVDPGFTSGLLTETVDIFMISIVEQQKKYSQRDVDVDTVIFQTR